MTAAIGVCGFGRCGSTMTMRMLSVGGVPTIGAPGTYELEDNGLDRLGDYVLEGQAVKLLDAVLHQPIPAAPWKFIWMDRDVEQQAKSVVKFMRGIGGIDPGPFARGKFAKSYVRDRDRAVRLLQTIADGRVWICSFEEMLRHPRWHAERLAEFLAPDFELAWEDAAAEVHERGPECRPNLDFERSVMDRA